MKNAKSLLLAIMIVFLTSCGVKQEAASSTSMQTIELIQVESQASDQKNLSNDLNNLGNIKVEQSLFTVTLNIPKDFVGTATQEDLNEICKEKGYHSVKLNKDGSATYIMTQSQHDKMMDEYRVQINAELSSMINSESYPNFTKIDANNNFTEFIIFTKSKSLDLTESFSVMQFYVYSGLYNIFNGTTAENVTIIFKNSDTGEIIHTENSNSK